MKKDTIRILVSWECNLKWPYCCNEQPRFRKGIKPTRIQSVNWDKYQNFCISGGEPLLNFHLIQAVCKRIPAGRTVILYTNGILLNSIVANKLANLGVQYINVGLHAPASFERIINQVRLATESLGMSVRFHAQDIYANELTAKFPSVNFRFWKMDDCDRGNEDRIVLTTTDELINSVL